LNIIQKLRSVWDTCHVFAAGHDISVKGGMNSTIDLLVEIAGIDRFQLVHANDSMDVCGALKDRHQNIGDGHIGIDPFKELLSHPAVANAPLSLETPGEEREHGKKLHCLRNYAANVCSSQSPIKTCSVGIANCGGGLGICLCGHEGCNRTSNC
jgi:endonuclease IV